MPVLTAVLGLAALVLGARLLVRGAVALAAAARVPPLVIGLTVVAFGTSAPELWVSVRASIGGHPEIALGNVVGSNLFNVLFILGVASLIAPLRVSHTLIRLDVPLMVGASVLLLLLGLDGALRRLEGGLLIAGLIVYTAWTIRQGRRSAAASDDAQVADESRGFRRAPVLLQLLTVGAGLLLLSLGSNWFIDGAASVARVLGLSDLIIGLTIVAGGTSLPEAVTSVVASLRGQRDMAVGNVVGSNLFNLLGVLGLSGLLAPGGLPVPGPAVSFDIPAMAVAAAACLPIFFSGRVIARWEGALFLGYYVAYVLYLFLAATHHNALPGFTFVMVTVVLPLTAVTLVVTASRSRAPVARA